MEVQKKSLKVGLWGFVKDVPSATLNPNLGRDHNYARQKNNTLRNLSSHLITLYDAE